MSSDTPIRTTRRRNFFILDNALYDRGIAAKIGSEATSLYCYLVRKANQADQSWPSQKTMAEATGMSDRHVRRCIDVLEQALLISRTGWRGQTRTIEILDIPTDRLTITPDSQSVPPDTVSAPPGLAGRSTPDSQSDNKNTVYKDPIIKTQDQDIHGGVNPPRAEVRMDSDGVFILEPEKPTLSQQTWTAYESTYRRRYDVAPVRNLKVNAQIAQLVKRLGAEAPAVAAFFITHNDMRYVKSCHSVGLLLMDAEKLRTEWARGRKVTHVEAKSAEQRDSVTSQVDRVHERIQQRSQRNAAGG